MKKKKKIKFRQMTDGEWHMPIMKNYHMKCCDCGLVHKVDFRILDDKTQKQLRGKRVLMRAFRRDNIK